MVKQTTIASEVTFQGRGLHSGRHVQITCKPATDDYGIVFQRVDLDEKPLIPAQLQYVSDTSRSTTIAKDGAVVQTVEHLMAALVGCGIDNALIEINGPELPILDGSAVQYVKKFQEVGNTTLQNERKVIKFDHPVRFEHPNLGIEISYKPSDTFKITVKVDYGTEVLASQEAEISSFENFENEIANSRTFVFLHELSFLINNNLVKGGDVDNAIVFVDKKPNAEELEKLAAFFNKKDLQVNENGTLNNLTLHHDNEPARHKLLDLIGDLYLLGAPIQGEIVAVKPGHFANTEFGKYLEGMLR